MNADEGYKYLGIIENRENEVSKETYSKIKNEILRRVSLICKTKLNGKNSIKAMNEYALSVINYIVGMVPIEPDKYQELDDEVRKVLIEHGLHMQPASKERLYLPRKDIGRRLHNLVHKSERMQLDHFNLLEASRETSIRRKTILQAIRDEKAPLALFDIYLREKYQIRGALAIERLLEVQISSLNNNIETKNNHRKLYEVKKNEEVDINGSSIWLHKGNVKASYEAKLCYLQDRNLFGNKVGKCPH